MVLAWNEISELLVAATLLQSVVFAAFLLSAGFRGSLANRFLLLALVLMAAVKADQLYQLRGGLTAFPEWGFALAPLQPLLTPALFFFVRARTSPHFRLRPAHGAHLIPAALYLGYLTLFYFRLDAGAKAALLQSDALSGPFHSLVVPILFDLLQVAYVAASLMVLSQHGLALRRWFSRVDDKNLAWLKQLLVLWAAVFMLHLTMALSQGLFREAGQAAAATLALNAAHFAFINILLMLAIVDQASEAGAKTPPRYTGSLQTEGERVALFHRAQAVLAGRQLFLDPDLTLQGLADSVGSPARDLSEAINGAGGETFFSLVNKARVDFAKGRLASDSAARILDVALASGFNSKSTFNEAFRKYAGTTPSAWRAAASEAGATAGPQVVAD